MATRKKTGNTSGRKTTGTPKGRSSTARRVEKKPRATQAKKTAKSRAKKTAPERPSQPRRRRREALERVGRPLKVTAESPEEVRALPGFRTLLVPLDFSTHSDRALDYAIRLGRRLDASLLLLHAYELPALVTPLPETPASAGGRLAESLRVAAEEEMAERVRRVERHDLRVRSAVVAGTPAAVICEAAERQGVDLIVMASRGRSGLAHVLLGSVTERTIHRAPCPVLTLPAPDDD